MVDRVLFTFVFVEGVDWITIQYFSGSEEENMAY